MTATNRYDEVLALAQRLPLAEQLRLVSALTSAAAGTLGQRATATSEPDGWERWAQLRAELSARPAGATSMAGQLDRDREERQATLEGRDVHP